MKASTAPRLSRGFTSACDHIGPSRQLIVYPGGEAFKYSKDIEVLPLAHFIDQTLQEFS